MRTRVGQAALVAITKRMVDLNNKLVWMANQMDGRSPSKLNVVWMITEGLQEVAENRKEHQRLQEMINNLVLLENFLGPDHKQIIDDARKDSEVTKTLKENGIE